MRLVHAGCVVGPGTSSRPIVASLLPDVAARQHDAPLLQCEQLAFIFKFLIIQFGFFFLNLVRRLLIVNN